MQTRTLLAAIATAAVAAVATPSFSTAQNPPPQPPPQKQTSKGEVAMSPSFGSLISAINSGTANADKLKSLTSVNAGDVQFVNVEDLIKGNDVQALTDAMSKNKDGIESLRTALGSNPAISLLLAPDSAAAPGAAAKPSTKDIVAADVSAGNKLVLYYWKKASSQ
jgi:hypothetical protein